MEYVDRDYLEDYAAYYSRCFHEYSRFCTRIHFFKCDFEKTDFINLIKNKQKKSITRHNLIDTYLGFVVIKPLPNAIFGRTRLAVYGDDNKHRFYPVIVDDKVCLCGIMLPIKSLAYQEQDAVAAACATSAVWSSFHGTGRLFQHEILSPIEITKRATERTPMDDRSLPSKGLNLPQMAAAIKSVGLEPYTVNLNSRDNCDSVILKAQVYAYSLLGIPCILCVELLDFSNPKKPYSYDLHAVTITGFNIDNKNNKDCGFNLRANDIDKLYVHDDQIGPFARITFDKQYENLKYTNIYNKEVTLKYSLASSWKGKNKSPGDVRFKPVFLLIPLYHKIRIPYEYIQTQISAVDQVIKFFIKHGYLDNYTLKWDIFLSFGKDLKEDLLNTKLDQEVKKTILTMNIPRFVWRAKAFTKKRTLFEIYFDATDIENGNDFFYLVSYRHSFVANFKKALKLNLDELKKYPEYFKLFQKLSN